MEAIQPQDGWIQLKNELIIDNREIMMSFRDFSCKYCSKPKDKSGQFVCLKSENT